MDKFIVNAIEFNNLDDIKLYLRKNNINKFINIKYRYEEYNIRDFPICHGHSRKYACSLTLIKWAIWFGRLKIVKCLLQNGADINKSSKHDNGLWYYIEHGGFKVLKYLLSENIIARQNPLLCLQMAIETRKISNIKYVLNNYNCTNLNRSEIFKYSVKTNVKITKFIVEYFDLTNVFFNELTLYIEDINEDYKLLKYLLDLNIKICNPYENEADADDIEQFKQDWVIDIKYSIEYNNKYYPYIKLLLEHKILDPNLTSHDESLLDCVLSHGINGLYIAKLLIKHGADVNNINCDDIYSRNFCLKYKKHFDRKNKFHYLKQNFCQDLTNYIMQFY